MKWQWILWAVYLMLISFVPCGEGDEQCGTETSIVLQQPSAPGNDPCADDHCSPFCCCFCCQVQCSAELFNQPSVPVIKNAGRSNTEYIESLHPVYCGNIWQPPKIPAT